MIASGLVVASLPSISQAAICESLASLALPNTTVTMATTVAAGEFAPPSGQAGRGAFGVSFVELPGFCRIAATLTPSSDSDIKVEVWMPAANWNGKYLAVGNGGWAGAISYAAMADALRAGYATSSTDTGHAGAGGSFALGDPEKLIDFAYRSVHEMTVTAKATIEAFYGRRPRLSYWNGCSTGGRQGLKEAQRFPDDYDGIIAGAPAIVRPLNSSHRPFQTSRVPKFQGSNCNRTSTSDSELWNLGTLEPLEAGIQSIQQVHEQTKLQTLRSG
jgi:feruloyl esterase